MLLNCRFLKNKKNETGYPKRKITYWIKKHAKKKKRKKKEKTDYQHLTLRLPYSIASSGTSPL